MYLMMPQTNMPFINVAAEETIISRDPSYTFIEKTDLPIRNSRQSFFSIFQ